MKITVEKKMWCELIEPYYSSKKDVKGRTGEIVGESLNREDWWVKWEGIPSRYKYPKEFIKLIK